MSIHAHKWTFFRLIVTSMVIYYLIIKVNWSDMVTLTNNIDYFWIGLAYLCFGGAIFASAFRLNFLLKVQEIILSFKTLFALTFIGFFFNSFLF